MNSTVQRIAFVLTQSRGGPVDVTVNLAAALAREPGLEVRIFGPRPDRGAERIAHLLEQVEVPRKGDVKAVRGLRDRLRAWGPHLIHAQDRRAGLACAPLGWRPGCPVVHTYHGVPDDVSQRWLLEGRGASPSVYTRLTLGADALVARAVQRTVVVSPVMADFLIDRLRVPGDRVVHIDNGVELNVLPVPPERLQRLVFVGMLIPRKGVDVLIRAISLLNRAVDLLVVGEGPQRGDLERLAAASGVADHVVFTGFRPDVPQLLEGGGVFVLPALMEQQPLVLMEAMAAGLPVVATDVGGVEQMVGSAAGASVIPADDPVALADAIEDTLRRTDWHRAALANQAHVAQRFSVELCAQRHLALYRSLIAA